MYYLRSLIPLVVYTEPVEVLYVFCFRSFVIENKFQIKTKKDAAAKRSFDDSNYK